MDLKECYSAAGANYEDVMRRLRSEKRVDRFLKMFLEDQSFAMLCAAMESGDMEGAFHAVHTMKGICMNLGFDELLDVCIALTENLRSGKSDGNTATCFEAIKVKYLRTTQAIRDHFN